MFLVDTNLCLNDKALKIPYNFGAIIYDYIKNYVHYGGNQPYQNYIDGYIFENMMPARCRWLNL